MLLYIRAVKEKEVCTSLLSPDRFVSTFAHKLQERCEEKGDCLHQVLQSRQGKPKIAAEKKTDRFSLMEDI